LATIKNAEANANRRTRRLIEKPATEHPQRLAPGVSQQRTLPLGAGVLGQLSSASEEGQTESDMPPSLDSVSSQGRSVTVEKESLNLALLTEQTAYRTHDGRVLVRNTSGQTAEVFHFAPN